MKKFTSIAFAVIAITTIIGHNPPKPLSDFLWSQGQEIGQKLIAQL